MLAHMTATLERAEAWATPAGLSRYSVSDQSRVRNVVTGNLLSPTVGDRGYLRISSLRADDGRVVTRHVHTLVMLAHAGQRPDGPDGKPLEICHGKAGKLVNWWPENLRYDTAEANRAVPVRETAFPLVTGVACVVGGDAAATVSDRRAPYGGRVPRQTRTFRDI